MRTLAGGRGFVGIVLLALRSDVDRKVVVNERTLSLAVGVLENDDGVVVEELAAQDPVAGHEAGQVRADVADGPTIVKVSQVRVVAHRRRLILLVSGRRAPRGDRKLKRAYPEKGVDGRVDGRCPGVCEDVVIRVCQTGVFDEVLEVAVRSTTPALCRRRGCIHEVGDIK